MIKSLKGPAAHVLAPVGTAPWRAAAAAALRSASRLLEQLAQRLHCGQAAGHTDGPADMEFCAEAGAPEGALYLNGELVGYLPGVRRL